MWAIEYFSFCDELSRAHDEKWSLSRRENNSNTPVTQFLFVCAYIWFAAMGFKLMFSFAFWINRTIIIIMIGAAEHV